MFPFHLPKLFSRKKGAFATFFFEK